MVRAKFKVVQKIEFDNGFRIVMSAVTCGSKENEEFFKWTPSAKLEMELLNEETANKFPVKKEFYLDFTEA